MLQLSNITKRYEAGEFSVDALRGVTLAFRKSEFVAILGQSGCGKTTLLNIVGGLDKYTTGDLIINGKSTTNFTDRDWDAYRNYTIGFVFQSYNLIPHQTVLQNVELALALSGVKKAERKRRAKEALDQVGLQNMYHKRPSEMSGGQMQRVAIARAIVNNPDIILADEPTGALDTETSVQVMDILKEISKERLVIMVTHNPDLADTYATRTVKMLDGLVVSDSMPLTEEELQQQIAMDTDCQEQEAEVEISTNQKGKSKKAKKKKPSLSFATSFMLSLKNLISKKGRTVLTSFAGSIGIIGIALIFAVSNGMTAYINTVQEETLASYPLTLQQTHTDMSSMFLSFSQGAEGGDHPIDDKVYEKLALYNLTKALNSIEESENDLGSYKAHLDEKLKDTTSDLYNALNGVHYSYNLDLLIYTKNGDEVIRSDTSELMMELMGNIYGVDMSSMQLTGGGFMATMMNSSMGMTMWQELLPAKDGKLINDLLYDQYDCIYGSWPNAANEIVLVVDDKNEIDDMTLYALGLKSSEEIQAIIDSARTGETVEIQGAKNWSFAEICAQEYKTIFNYECFEYSPVTKTYVDVRDQDNGILGNGLERLYNDDNVGMKLKVTGIIRPNKSASNHMLSGSICYTQALTELVITKAQDAPIVKAQKENPNVDIFTGLYFQDNNIDDQTKATKLAEYLQKLSTSQKAKTFLQIASVPTEKQIDAKIEALTEQAKTEQGMLQLRGQLKAMLAQTGNEQVGSYIDNMDDEAIVKLIPQMAPTFVQMENMMALGYQYKTEEEQSTALDLLMQTGAAKQKASWFDLVIEFAPTTYEDNLITLGCLDLSVPSTINLYASSFANKEIIEADIEEFNSTREKQDQIKYNDLVGLLMSGITTIIDAITYVLVAFVSISLIVSSIMIGVITLISVQERTKEIGILRAVGASKKNVSGMFNVETVIIGFASGLLGVLVTYLLCIPINLILRALTGIASLKAILPIGVAIGLIAISMLLTLIAGIIPSRSASKKDPVIALRTE